MNSPAISRNELETFIPHTGTMLLLDGIRSWDESFETLRTEARVTREHPFFEEDLGGVPSIVAFELMAQSVAALSGLERHLKGDSEPRIGYIIGVRAFEADSDVLPEDEDLEIGVNELFRDGPVVSFECEVRCGGDCIVTGTINAYEPERAAE